MRADIKYLISVELSLCIIREVTKHGQAIRKDNSTDSNYKVI